MAGGIILDCVIRDKSSFTLEVLLRLFLIPSRIQSWKELGWEQKAFWEGRESH